MNKLFTLLFPIQSQYLKQYRETVPKLNGEIQSLNNKIKHLEEMPKPSLADVMRENMALLPHHFTNTDTNGNALNPFEGLSEKESEVRIQELNQVFNNRAFNELLEYLTNKQVHFTMEHATDDAQIYAGRFNINGLALMKTALNKYHMIYQESISPPDSYDEHELISD